MTPLWIEAVGRRWVSPLGVASLVDDEDRHRVSLQVSSFEVDGGRA